MGSVKKLALAGATALMTTAATAADFPQAPPPVPHYVRAPEVYGWYIRGDVGVGNQGFRSFDFTQTGGGPWPASWRIDVNDIKDTFFVGFGIGYAWNNWLRFDVTGEYRADVKFKAVGSYTEFCAAGTRCFDLYDGNHQAWVGLINAYLDLGTWWCLTPFVGAGVGGAYHTISSLTDTGHGTAGDALGVPTGPISVLGFAPGSRSNWSFAWAAHAGVAYTVTSQVKIDFAYRYLNMGTARTGEVLCGPSGCGVGGGPRAYYNLRHLDSHDLKIGIRWNLQPEPVVQPPLMRRG